MPTLVRSFLLMTLMGCTSHREEACSKGFIASTDCRYDRDCAVQFFGCTPYPYSYYFLTRMTTSSELIEMDEQIRACSFTCEKVKKVPPVHCVQNQCTLK